jgi:hypothetical protein
MTHDLRLLRASALCAALSAACCLPLAAQTVSGYVKEMPGACLFQKPPVLPDGNEMHASWYNLVHNRLNFTFGISKEQPYTLSVNAGMRNRFFAGRLISQIPQYADMTTRDDGLADLSHNLINANGYIFNTAVDRLYIDCSCRNIQVKLGRQRVNWGIGLVWNPNDIFNAFSYMDFDYEERPGSDALSLTWYRSPASGLDVVYKTGTPPDDNRRNHTLAARYFFNSGVYDWQVIAGKCPDDATAGVGWSGSLRQVSFRGEAAVFVPLPKGEDNRKTAVSATLELDYTFAGALYLHGAVLFTSLGSRGGQSRISLINPSDNISAKQLSAGMFELFGNISRTFSPIVTGGVAAMLNPADGSLYLGPTVTVSLMDDLELAAVAQLLLGKENSEYGATGNVFAGFIRLKHAF